MKVYGVIMAGGGGTRFWPLSRKAIPKQLLNLSGKNIMLNEAADRLFKVCGKDDVFVLTNAAQAEKTLEFTEGRIKRENVLSEPCARNTAACIGYAAAVLLKKYGDGIMVITPSDAYIRNEEKFAEVLRTAVKAAEGGDYIVTVGIEPYFPATGYGYIKCGNGDKVKEVLRFVEKPCLEKAEEYLLDGNYVWNSGMFVCRASLMLEKFSIYLPEAYEKLMEIYEGIGTAFEREIISRVYPSIPSVSVDYAIMEKSQNILVVPGDFGWSDVGSWDMLGAVRPCDGDGNIFSGDVVAVNCKNVTAVSTGRTVAAADLENIVIVETADAVLVCPRDKAQDVKLIVEKLTKDKREELL